MVEVVAVLDYSVWSWMSGSDVTAAGETDTLMNLYLYFAHTMDTVSDTSIAVILSLSQLMAASDIIHIYITFYITADQCSVTRQSAADRLPMAVIQGFVHDRVWICHALTSTDSKYHTCTHSPLQVDDYYRLMRNSDMSISVDLAGMVVITASLTQS